MSKRTEGLWHVREGADEGTYYVCAPGHTIALCDARPPEECEANADFIVKACNSHYNLLDALEMALAHELHEDGKCGCCWTEKARAAISKAREV